jgi:hypothetical protein
MPYASLPGLARAAATSSVIARKGESSGTAIVKTFSNDWQMYSNESTPYLTSASRCGAIEIGVVGPAPSVYPSARAPATAPNPIVPDMPSRLTTTNGWPSCPEIAATRLRAITSTLPPAGKPTMTWTGRDG